MPGRRMEIRYCSLMRIADGKVVEGRDYYDSASIARQLGLMADQGGAPGLRQSRGH